MPASSSIDGSCVLLLKEGVVCSFRRENEKLCRAHVESSYSQKAASVKQAQAHIYTTSFEPLIPLRRPVVLDKLRLTQSNACFARLKGKTSSRKSRYDLCYASSFFLRNH